MTILVVTKACLSVFSLMCLDLNTSFVKKTIKSLLVLPWDINVVNCSQSLNASADFPTAVGPATTTTLPRGAAAAPPFPSAASLETALLGAAIIKLLLLLLLPLLFLPVLLARRRRTVAAASVRPAPPEAPAARFLRVVGTTALATTWRTDRNAIGFSKIQHYYDQLELTLKGQSKQPEERAADWFCERLTRALVFANEAYFTRGAIEEALRGETSNPSCLNGCLRGGTSTHFWLFQWQPLAMGCPTRIQRSRPSQSSRL